MSKSFHKRYLQKTKPNLDISLQQKNVLTKNRKEKKKCDMHMVWCVKKYKPKKNQICSMLYIWLRFQLICYLCPNYLSNYDNKITRKLTSCLKECIISSEYSCLENTLTATSCNNMDTISTTHKDDKSQSSCASCLHLIEKGN